MPAVYAHYAFGRAVLAALPPETRARLSRHRPLFDLGLHGPDLLFYYRPLHRCAVNAVGYDTHGRSGRAVFSRAAERFRPLRGDDREKALCFLSGYVCHFMLDRACHAIVFAEQERGFSHSAMEMELDRALLVRDGEDPVRRLLTTHIAATGENAAVIAPFFPPLSPAQVKQALRGTITCHRVLRAPSRAKRWLIDRVSALAGKYDLVHGMVMGLAPDETLRPVTAELLRALEAAVAPTAALVRDWEERLTGARFPEAYFDLNFDAGEAKGEETT